MQIYMREYITFTSRNAYHVNAGMRTKRNKSSVLQEDGYMYIGYVGLLITVQDTIGTWV